MAQLLAFVVTRDEEFRRQVGQLLRSSAVPVGIIEDRASRETSVPDLVLIDLRGDSASGLAAIERVRAGAPGTAVFAIAAATDPDLILQAMRAGAGEFFAWPPSDEAFHGAIRRLAARREKEQGAKQAAKTFVFFGAKGGAGTTTVAVNCGVELARLSKRATLSVDLKPGLGEVGLFLGVRPRYTVLDAIDNMHRLDREFLRELATKHKSGLEILAGSEQFDRPSAADGSAIEELVRLLGRNYEYIVIDAGSQINSCTVGALYAADSMFLLANPDVACVRNAQRLFDRVRQLGACGERTRFVLNRAAEPYPIPLKQIEAAVGHPIYQTFPSDYKTVSTAFNSGVPLSLSGNTDLAAQFEQFTKRLLDPSADSEQAVPTKRGLGLERIASLW
jgi:pilus assembly protein CpaE